MNLTITDSRMFFNDSNDQLAGEVSFFKLASYNALVCEHVFVAPSLRGQSVAEHLMDDFVEYVQKQDMKIYPLCPYAKRYFAKHPELASLSIQSTVTEEKIREFQLNKGAE